VSQKRENLFLTPGVIPRRGSRGCTPSLFAKISLKLTMKFWNLENIIEIECEFLM
jgi:hypothetical protein